MSPRPPRHLPTHLRRDRYTRAQRQAIRSWMGPEIEMLAEDVDYVLDKLPVELSARRAVALRYREIWLQAADAEPVLHRKSNSGRRAANTFLRERRKP